LASNNSFRPTRPWTSCYLQLLETVPSKRIGTSSLIHGVKMFILWYSDLIITLIDRPAWLVNVSYDPDS
jgi:hypothetical protein